MRNACSCVGTASSSLKSVRRKIGYPGALPTQIWVMSGMIPVNTIGAWVHRLEPEGQQNTMSMKRDARAGSANKCWSYMVKRPRSRGCLHLGLRQIVQAVILAKLVHVEVALQDPLLHGVGGLGLLRHLADRRFHNSKTLGTLVAAVLKDWRWSGHGATLGARTEVLCKVVAFACRRPCQRVIKLDILFNILCNDVRPDRGNGYGSTGGEARGRCGVDMW
jgi:hypothetical protein